MKSIFSFFAVALAGMLFLGGCNKEESIVDSLNQPPAGVTDEQSAISYLALADEFVTNTEQTMDDGEMYPAEYGNFGKLSADITPLRFGRCIRNVIRNVSITTEPGDSIAEAIVTKDIVGVFRIRGIDGNDDTVTVEKPFHDRAQKRVLFRRIARETERWWRNWMPVGTSLVEGRTVEPNNNIEISKIQMFLPNGDTVSVTEPLRHMMRYRWAQMMDQERPPVPELLAGQQLTMRVTVVSASPDTDLVLLRFGYDPLHKHRVRMALVDEEDNGNGTFTRVYERMWTVHAHRGFFHAAVDANTRGTIFDDAEPYSVSWWGVPYRVF